MVTPGVIDAHSHLGVYATPNTFASSDGNEATNPITAEVNAADSFWPQDPGLRRAAAGGVTAMLILPGSANLVGGRGFPIKNEFGRSAEEVRFPGAPDSLKLACGENPKRVYGKEKKTGPSTRMGNIAVDRQAFSHARDYLIRWDQWKKKVEQKGEDAAGPMPARDLKLETLAGVLKGEILVQNHCYRADEMRIMMDIADEFGFQIRAFHHAVEAYKIRDVLAQKGVAVATWADWFGFKMEAWDAIPWNAGLLESAGVKLIIHSDSADGIQRLNQEAGKALARAREAGLTISDDAALRWFTLNPAWAMGVDKLTGSLEPGKMADIAVWDHDPLTVYARAQKVFVDGVQTYDSKTGPSVPSDFEVGEPQEWARMTPQPGAVPKFERRDQAPLALEQGDCVQLNGATVLSAGESKRASVTVQGGKITSVSAEAGAAPAKCRVIDAQGLVITAGLIEPESPDGLAEVLGEEATNDVGGKKQAPDQLPVHAALLAADSINPSSVMLPVARTGGVTALVSTPGGGLVSGQSAVLSLDGTLLKERAAMIFHLGGAGHNVLGTRGAALETVRELFDDARFYAQKKADYEKGALRKVLVSHRDLEALGEVLSGKLLMVIDANRESDLRAALTLINDYKLHAIVRGGAEAWRLASEFAQAKVPLILDPTSDLPDDFDQLGTRPDAAAILIKAGARVMFSTFSHDRVRTLAQSAGNAVAWGVPHEQALMAITSNVADAFGLDNGRVQQGKRADLVLWSGDPLELASRPLAMWIGGKQQKLESRQNALLEKYRRVP
ncbi:MAG: amidohydrolase family protein [Deltaproteobacteria bacterium]|nr:amidohydrolase family protein [Deltaproteobacteria bacterium]